MAYRLQTPRSPARAHSRSHPPHVVRFVQAHLLDARSVAARAGIPAEVVLAQSALETDWGRRVRGNAWFGVKGVAPSGRSSTFETHEVALGGRRIGMTATFRAYDDYREAADDYASLVRRRYPRAMQHRDDPVAFADALARQGYATDPQYGWKLASVIRTHVAPLLRVASSGEVAP